MAGRNAQFGGRTALFIGLSLGAASTMAGYDVYSHDDTTLTFNVDVAAASFHGKDSWFGESSSFLGEPTNQWSEFGVEPRLSLQTPLAGGTVFGQVSGVYTATFSDDASGLNIDNDSDDAQLEQGHLGWRTGELFGEGYTTSFSVGRQDYKIGSGMLIADGGNDGGEFGGWFVGKRGAFMESGIARFDGDEPGTPKDEQFREIAYGFDDWGSWFQGEITGNLSPGDAAKEWTGGDEDWLYSMLYVSYSY